MVGLRVLYAPILALAMAASPAVAQLQVRSPTVAFHLSLWGTVVPVGLSILAVTTDTLRGPWGRLVYDPLLYGSALAAGPLLGYLFGGQWERGYAGVRARGGLLAAVLFFAAPLRALDEHGRLGSKENPNPNNLPNQFHADELLFYGLLAAMAGSAIYDIATVGRHVRAGNEGRGGRVSIFPVPVPATGRVGLGVRIAF